MKSLIEQLKLVTIQSQPNIKFKEQMELIEAIEAKLEELNQNKPVQTVDPIPQPMEEIFEESPAITPTDPEESKYAEENAKVLAKIKEMENQKNTELRKAKKAKKEAKS